MNRPDAHHPQALLPPPPTCPRRDDRRWLPIALLGITVLATWAPRAFAFDLEGLAASRAHVTESTARFHETRHIGALTAPVERTGTLSYRRPDHLEMNVETPRPEKLVIDGGTLRVTTAAGVRTLSLDSEPALLAWTESLRATLAGDIASLSRHFETRFSGDEHAWSLTLEPRDPVLRSQIASIVIGGAGEAIARVEMREQGGDDAVMEITAQHAPAR
jgi:outer membrane lipoprotein-sorting protein